MMSLSYVLRTLPIVCIAGYILSCFCWRIIGDKPYRYVLPILFLLTIMFTVLSMVLTGAGLNTYIGRFALSYEEIDSKNLVKVMNASYNMLKSEIELFRIAQLLTGSLAITLEASVLYNCLKPSNSLKHRLLKTTILSLYILATLSIMYLPIIYGSCIKIGSMINILENTDSTDAATLNAAQGFFISLMISLSTYTIVTTGLLIYTHFTLAYFMYLPKRYFHLEFNLE